MELVVFWVAPHPPTVMREREEHLLSEKSSTEIPLESLIWVF